MILRFGLDEVLHEHNVSIARPLDTRLLIDVLLHGQITHPYVQNVENYVSSWDKLPDDTDFSFMCIERCMLTTGTSIFFKQL